MVLLTSSTVSFMISSSIIGLFTFLLFLSGYVLQQRTVRSIQLAIRPPDLSTSQNWLQKGAAEQLVLNGGEQDDQPIPKDDVTAPVGKFAKIFGDGKQERLNNLGSQEADKGDRNPARHAYLQILTKPSASDICSSVLFFDLLASNSSIPTTEHVVLYPESWDVNSPTRNIALALGLLRESSGRSHRRKSNVVVHAVNTLNKNDGSPSESQLFKSASAKLAQYERIMYIRAPGLLLDAEKLDDLFLSQGTTFLSSKGAGEGESGNDAWVSTRLSAASPDLPSVLLITSQPRRSGHTSVTSHVLEPSLEDAFVDAAVSASGKEEDPAYVYFRRDTGGRRERESWYYHDWMSELQLVCNGIDVSY